MPPLAQKLGSRYRMANARRGEERGARMTDREREKQRMRGKKKESTSGGNSVTRKGMCKCHRERRAAAILFLRRSPPPRKKTSSERDIVIAYYHEKKDICNVCYTQEDTFALSDNFLARNFFSFFFPLYYNDPYMSDIYCEIFSTPLNNVKLKS